MGKSSQTNQGTYMKHRFFSLFFALFICCAPPALSQETVTSAPIRIEADRMETSQEANVVLFSGHVRANQNDLVINADTMTVHYVVSDDVRKTPIGTPADGLTQKIAKITAKDNVQIVQGDWVATGNTLDFNADKRIAILAGNAKAWQNQNMVSGNKITLYLNEGRSVVEGGPVEGERVKAFIYPGSEKSDNAAEPLQEK